MGRKLTYCGKLLSRAVVTIFLELSERFLRVVARGVVKKSGSTRPAVAFANVLRIRPSTVTRWSHERRVAERLTRLQLAVR